MADKDRKFDSADLIGYIAIVVIVISLGFIGLKITGHATDTATVNVTIEGAESINFTTDLVNFGSGAVNDLAAGATIDTESTVTDGTWSTTSSGLVLENIGNVNVTLDLKSDKDAESFIGGSSPTFKVKISDSASNTGACGSVANSFDSYQVINTTDQRVCDNFGYNSTVDELDVDVELYIPNDASPGQKTATITATATSI